MYTSEQYFMAGNSPPINSDKSSLAARQSPEGGKLLRLFVHFARFELSHGVSVVLVCKQAERHRS